jgi:hypothetical protein
VKVPTIQAPAAPEPFFTRLLKASKEADMQHVLNTEINMLRGQMATSGAYFRAIKFDPRMFRRFLKTFAFSPFAQCPAADWVQIQDVSTWAADFELQMYAILLRGSVGSKKSGKAVAKTFFKTLGKELLESGAGASGYNTVQCTPSFPQYYQQGITGGGYATPAIGGGGAAAALLNATKTAINAAKGGKMRDPGRGLRNRLRMLGYGTGSDDSTFHGKPLYEVVNVQADQYCGAQVKQLWNSGYLSSSVLLHRTRDNDYQQLYRWAVQFDPRHAMHGYSGGIGRPAYITYADPFLQELMAGVDQEYTNELMMIDPRDGDDLRGSQHIRLDD